MVSAIRAKVMGSIPPTPSPMTKQVKRFSSKVGMVAQVETAMKRIAASMIEARLPILSPNHPQRKDPTTVPEIPESG